MRRIQRGFTLIELLVVIAIIAILATLAAPSFLGLLANASITQATNGFISDTRYARGEAMRRGKSVTVCRTADYTAASPVCSAGDGAAVGGWMQGWVVFLDSDGSGSFDAANDIVLRAQEPLARISDFFAVGASTPAAVATGNRIIYDGTGRAIGQSGRWLVHAAGSYATDAKYTRTLCMNSVGRVKVQTGDVAC
ncbi:MAG: GspH/FimT family pseudopilin [Polaromonas sp.]|nr:GspH/FimT family pseudopilin [Polaromonas sp.]